MKSVLYNFMTIMMQDDARMMVEKDGHLQCGLRLVMFGEFGKDPIEAPGNLLNVSVQVHASPVAGIAVKLLKGKLLRILGADGGQGGKTSAE